MPRRILFQFIGDRRPWPNQGHFAFQERLKNCGSSSRLCFEEIGPRGSLEGRS
jgi:hypothetical protein